MRGGVRRQVSKLASKNSSDEEFDVEASLLDGVRLHSAIHEQASFSVMSLMHALYRAGGTIGSDSQAEGFKGAVLLWSGAYYVAYALMMTIAFALLVVIPEPRDLNRHAGHARWLHLRPTSDTFDAIVQIAYVFFAAAACYDSTWGMMMCAEWGVRSGVVPPSLYERFVKMLDPSDEGPDARGVNRGRLTSWFCRCFETRAVHKEVPTIGCFCQGEEDRTGFGLSKAPAWDPFYLVDRTVQSLFLAGVCFLYLTQGVIHAGIGIFFLLNLRERVKRHGLILSYAMQAALAEATKATASAGGGGDGDSDGAADGGGGGAGETAASSEGIASVPSAAVGGTAGGRKDAVAFDSHAGATSRLPPPAKLPAPSGAGQQRPKGSRAAAGAPRETVALDMRGCSIRTELRAQQGRTVPSGRIVGF